ncbi:hypothetical protein IPV08_23575 [Methylobacterium sp. SD274]|uniref:hypothetical protein n=1 Tax=Methylobacterium sp. SD274 TaxID=2782009 RepID=UPI001A9694EE|nr:hypothetical protein [Methylobacterium sp. SD274]MBO1022942.1 hypothetical protein [Methylobacterium sp. SD274]
MTAIAAASTAGTTVGRPGADKSQNGAQAPAATASSAVTKPAAVIDLSANARSVLASLVGTSTRTKDVTPFETMLKERTDALTQKLLKAFADKSIPADESFTLQLDDLGNLRTDSPYKKTMEEIFEKDPDLAKEFKEIASLNSMKAAQKAMEAFEKEKAAARDDDERSAAQSRFTTRLSTSLELSKTMVLKDGKLTSLSLDFMTKSVGETVAPKASEKAKQLAAKGVSIEV